MTRLSDNFNLDAPEHLRSHDRDLDAVDSRIIDIAAEVKGLKTILIGVLVATSTSAIMLAINLIVK